MDKDDKIGVTGDSDVGKVTEGNLTVSGDITIGDNILIGGPTTGVRFSDIEAFNSFIATPFLEIELPCGCKKEYSDKQDIPAENVKCEHDNYFIKIGE